MAQPSGTPLVSILDHVVQCDGRGGRGGGTAGVPVCSILNHVVQTRAEYA